MKTLHECGNNDVGGGGGDSGGNGDLGGCNGDGAAREPSSTYALR